MSTTFPRAARSQRGYSVEEVEDFLEEARVAYSADPALPTSLTATSIRRMSFAMERGGYLPADVDAALERLEDAFAGRERELARRELGDEAWFDQARAIGREIRARLERKPRQKFQRVSFLSTGYDPLEVDAFAERLLAYFRDGASVSVADVRSVAFRPRRAGYREAQVDYFLDTIVEAMLAVK